MATCSTSHNRAAVLEDRSKPIFAGRDIGSTTYDSVRPRAPRQFWIFDLAGSLRASCHLHLR
eukprot:114040-Pleurochrysis_carterae.AAC.1